MRKGEKVKFSVVIAVCISHNLATSLPVVQDYQNVPWKLEKSVISVKAFLLKILVQIILPIVFAPHRKPSRRLQALVGESSENTVGVTTIESCPRINTFYQSLNKVPDERCGENNWHFW